MHVTRWSLTIVFAALAMLLDVANLTVPILARMRGKNVSAVPLFGALFGIAACLLCPLPGFPRFIPLVVVLDFSVLTLLVYLIRRFVWRARP
jgi:hypothetical protein